MPSFDAELARILGRKAQDVRCDLLACGCGPDHVHVVVRLAAKIGIAQVVHRMKGGSAFDTRTRAAPSERLEWQRGYWALSLAPRDLDAVVRYVRNQRDHHRTPRTEAWQDRFELP